MVKYFGRDMSEMECSETMGEDTVGFSRATSSFALEKTGSVTWNSF